MDQKGIMTSAEIHDFGIEVVVKYLKKDGYEIKAVYTSIGDNLQIIAKKGSLLAYIMVRTSCYPEKGKLDDSSRTQIIKHAADNGATPYFSSVGIANSDADSDDGMRVPVRGAGFHVSYEGILELT